MDKLVPSFKASLLETTLSSEIELSEIGVDSLLDDGVFNDIPIVSTVIGLGRTAQNIQDRNLLYQTLHFIKAFNENSISTDKLNKYKQKMEKNPKRAEKELGRVLIILNSMVENKKSLLLGKVYHSYVNEEITWDNFCELSEAISRLFITDLVLLDKIYQKKITVSTQCKNYQVDRLLSIGFINATTKSMVIGAYGDSNTERYLLLSEFGKLFCRLIE